MPAVSASTGGKGDDASPLRKKWKLNGNACGYDEHYSNWVKQVLR